MYTRPHINRSAVLLCAFLLSQPLTGCGDCNADPEEPEDMAVQDMNDKDLDAPDQTDSPDLNSPDMTQDMPVDMLVDMMQQGAPCADDDACEDQEICAAGFCAAMPECDKVRQSKKCIAAYKDLGLTDAAASRAFCDAPSGRCTLGCVEDIECKAGEVCGDDGICSPFLGDLTGDDPGGEAAAPFKAGIGNTLMKFPIGLPLGGFGSRAANDGGRYSDALGSSHGQMHGLYARAMLLDSGDRQIMLIRMPIIFPTAPMLEQVARALQEKTGKDWRDSLVISGTHTHSGPGRFLHLPAPDNTILPLGSFGTDNFHDQAFEWVVESAVEAAELALDDLSDAQFGWEIVEAFDTDDEIASDRWGGTPPFDDNRLMFMRVDDLDGNPRALLFSFGTHGIYFDSSYASGDSIAGVERALEERFGEEYGRFVPTMFFNENGGSMSPRGDSRGHKENHKMEHIGFRFVDKLWQEVEEIETDRDVKLNATTLRFPLNYDALGYEPGEWSASIGNSGDLKYGGLQCSVSGIEDDDYTTYQTPGDVRCVGIDYTMYNRPPTSFLRSQMTALNIDGLTIITLPGEAAMELGWQVLAEVQKVHSVDPLEAWVWGYAQDHQFYLTPSNLRGPLPPFPGISTPMAPDDYPDYAFSYYQGGYEAGFTIWGGRMGDYLVERAIDVTGRLLGEPMNLPYEEPLPIQYSDRGMPDFPIDATPEAMVGMIVEDVPATAPRQRPIEFAWMGGDPGAEMPQAPHVILEVQDESGEFAPVMHTNARTYDNREHLMLTRLRKDSEDLRREWVVYWEELKSFPLGTYRFSVSGHYQNEAGERTPYALNSGTFEVIPDDALEITELSQAGDLITGRLAYAAAAAIDVRGGGQQDPAKVEGSYRMRHPDVPSGVSEPALPATTQAFSVELVNQDTNETFTYEIGDGVNVLDEQIEGRTAPVSRFGFALSDQPATSGTYDATFTLTDEWGNTGSATMVITIQ